MEAAAGIGHNSKPTREEIEQAFRIRTREQRIKEHTPFDLRWQWEVWLTDMPPHAKLVAFAIRIYATGNGGESRPSIDALVYMTGLSRQTVVTQLKTLEQVLLLEITRGKGRSGNSYELRLRKTMAEMAQVIDFQNSLAARRLNEGNSLASEPFQENNSLPDRPKNPVNSLIDAGNSLPARRDLTRDITNKGEDTREGQFGKVAATIAATFAAALPVAAAPYHPAEQVMVAAAECWQTPKAQMAASMSAHEARAQKQVWVTPTGLVEVAGDFRAELATAFPLVDLHCGLATAAVNVKPDLGAIRAMQDIRRQFGYLQNDAAAKEKRAASYRKSPDNSDAELAQYPPEVRARILAARAAKGAKC